MNNKGFISTSVVYSFFLIILLILLFIVSDLVNNRVLLNKFKEEVKAELSDDNLTRYLIGHSEELGLVYHDSSLSEGALDNSYRYSGANPNNYVCFGSDATTCPNDNLYRIIGVIDGKIKVVKSTAISSQAYSSSASNVYETSSIYNYLNSEFLNSFEDSWRNAIVNSNWYVGGFSSSYSSNKAFNIYDVEVGNNRSDTYISAKIGLMYVSDYAYATVTTNYVGPINGNSNWLHNNQNTWFITRVNNYDNRAYYLTNSGTLANNIVTIAYQIRPTFYLNGRLRYVSGDGSSASPYRIEV